MPRAKATKNTSNLGRATWKGTLKLSDDAMVSIPVKAYTSKIAPPKLRTIHKECETPIKQKLACPACGPIEKQDTGKAHEWHKDRLVTFSDSEISELQKPRDKAMAIAGYVQRGHLAPSAATGKTYYLMPDGAANHEAYLVFARALASENAMAVAEVTITSTTPAAIYPEDGILKLTLLEYPENVKAVADFEEELLELDLKKGHIDDAQKLIRRNRIKKFSWDSFEDSTTRGLLALIDEKVGAGESVAPTAGVLDLSGAFKKARKGRKKAARG